MPSVALVGAAIVPSLLILWYILSRDVNPEPRGVVWRTFGLGVVATLPACVAELVQDATWIGALSNPVAAAACSALFSAALCEELVKFAVLHRYASKHLAFDEPMDGVVYGVAASLGFATLENILYVVDGGLHVAMARAVLSVPGHASWGAIMGYFMGQSRFGSPEHRGRNLMLSFLVPCLLHGAYDFPLMLLSKNAGEGAESQVYLLLVPVLVLAGGWSFTLRRLRRLRSHQLSVRSPPSLREPLNVKALFIGVCLLVLGSLLAFIGGLMFLCLVVVAASGGSSSGPPLTMSDVAMWFAFATMLALGLWVFSRGLRRLKPGSAQSSAARSTVAALGAAP